MGRADRFWVSSYLGSGQQPSTHYLFVKQVSWFRSILNLGHNFFIPCPFRCLGLVWVNKSGQILPCLVQSRLDNGSIGSGRFRVQVNNSQSITYSFIK